MDPIKNPFAPGAGTPPPELAGRENIIQQAKIAFGRVAIGRPEKSIILVGLRGVGKTVLLNEIETIASENNYITISLEAHDGKTLPELLAPKFRTAFMKLSKYEQAKEYGRKGLAALKGFMNALKVSWNDVEVSFGINSEAGVADSGDLEADLPDLFLALGRTAKAAQTPVVILIDELQYLSTHEFSALIMSIHMLNQKMLPVIIVGAGLPQILGLAGNSKSYSERLFSYPEIGILTDTAAKNAIVNPTHTSGVKFVDDAITELLEISHKYPYFIQQWAYEAWNYAVGPEITKDDIVNCTPLAIDELDDSFFKVRFYRCTQSEKKYMRALAELGDGDHRSGDIAELLNVASKSVAPTRSALIKKGMIYSPAHGDTAFTVPLFHEYMRRVMPNWSK